MLFNTCIKSLKEKTENVLINFVESQMNTRLGTTANSLAERKML